MTDNPRPKDSPETVQPKQQNAENSPKTMNDAANGANENLGQQGGNKHTPGKLEKTLRGVAVAAAVTFSQNFNLDHKDHLNLPNGDNSGQVRHASDDRGQAQKDLTNPAQVTIAPQHDTAKAPQLPEQQQEQAKNRSEASGEFHKDVGELMTSIGEKLEEKKREE